MSDPVVVSRADPRAPDAAGLIEASRALMAAEFPAESNHSLPAEALAGADIRFFLATLSGRAAGCGALALKGEDAQGPWGEVKAFYVAPGARGHGLGRRLLDAIEAAARAEGLAWLRLETGDTLTHARALYAAAGFAECGPFGDYAADPRSIFMHKRLAG